MVSEQNSPRKYAHVWEKYRPAIIKLMKDSTDSPQEYKLYGHEFKDISPKKASGYSFNLGLENGRAVHSSKSNVLAQDLVYVLKKSSTASDLMDESNFKIQLDKQFVLKVEQSEEN